MGYGLGVDLGTTYTAAAVRVDGAVEVVRLGSRRPEIPSLVFVRDDGEVLVGEPAERRGGAEPGRLAREFKRRVGDPVPILVAGAPYSAHALLARLLKEVHSTVVAGREEAPTSVTLTHPANWGSFKVDLLRQAVRLADLDRVELRTEPEAAAVQYAAGDRVRPGEIVAVYDLGGGTFDAAVLRKTATGFELLGEPEGIEQLGGIDFDEAVLGHVLGTLGSTLDGLDPEDEETTAALGRLRRDCIEAKEGLSDDTEVLIPVALPGLHTRVRLNRSEFEAMVSPALTDTVNALRRALRSASVAPEQLRSVLLAGGSSRIPLVSQLLGTAFGRPVVLDPQPEHTIALGAARLTGSAAGSSAGPVTGSTAPVRATARPTTPAAPGSRAPTLPSTGSPVPTPPPNFPPAAGPTTGAPVPTPPTGPPGSVSPVGAPVPTSPAAAGHARHPGAPVTAAPGGGPPGPDGGTPPVSPAAGPGTSQQRPPGEPRFAPGRAVTGEPVAAVPVTDPDRTSVLARVAVPPHPGGGRPTPGWTGQAPPVPARAGGGGWRRLPRWAVPALGGLGVLILLVVIGALVLSPDSGGERNPTGAGTGSPVTVPNVVGKPKAQAAAELAAAGLSPLESSAEPTGSCAPGTVTDQDPPGGGTADRQSRVTLRVCGDSPELRVPDELVGDSFTAVKAALEEKNLEVKRVDVADSAPAGQVIEVDPPSGTVVEPGSLVEVSVSKGRNTTPPRTTPPARTTVPDVLGWSEHQARDALEHAGLRPVVEYVDATMDEADRVTAQHPHAGERVNRGTRVTITVTRWTAPSTPPTPPSLAPDAAPGG
ncbi:Hsp70 family protein [Plantactinospora sonchi]|uniref:Hsp70 family protein n=1 Tax=Plantactinospora sonchi TaxID=1544735 RepID=A0ABU7RR39_9ACTN